MNHLRLSVLFLFLTAASAGFAQQPFYDVVIRGGTIYDGSGEKPVVGDVAIRGDSIVAVGVVPDSSTRSEIHAKGMAVAPGFINMLSQADKALLVDGRAQSDVEQGVTLEVLGEGLSMGPLNAKMKQEMKAAQGDLKFDVAWNTLGGYLDTLEQRGIAPNVASYIGATTARIYYIGYEDRAPTAVELDSMKELVRQGMQEGALGLSTGLIYTPGVYAKTDEIIALARVAAQYGGLYASHLRSEGDELLESIDELTRIAKQANIPAEIFHFKAAGHRNWDKLDSAIQRIQNAQASGIHITADMYVYTAASSGLDAAMPPWVQEGGNRQWMERLKNPAIRLRVKHEMDSPGRDWDNFYFDAGSPERVLLVGFRNDSLKKYTGMSLLRVAAMRGESPEDAMMNLVIEDGSRVNAVYFMMLEPDVKKRIRLPWMSFGSDEIAEAPAGVFLKSIPHPRAYGNFARLLGRYTRELRVLRLEEAVRRLTSFPATTLHIQRRGALKPGYFADVVVFDPNTIIDHSTYDAPQQLATGVSHVFVNGVQVLKSGEPTGAKPGRIVRGPGWKKQ